VVQARLNAQTELGRLRDAQQAVQLTV
jgi:hypothetical protein